MDFILALALAVGVPPGLHHEQIKITPRDGQFIECGGATMLACEDGATWDPHHLPPIRDTHAAGESSGGERYPFTFKGSASGYTVYGGIVLGRPSRFLPWDIWKSYYDGDGLRLEGRRYLAQGVAVVNVEDGTSPQGPNGSAGPSAFATYQGCYFRHIHDDVVENDSFCNVSMFDCFLSGHTLVSERNDAVAGSKGTVFLMRGCVGQLELQPHRGRFNDGLNTRGGYPYPDGLGCGSLFKWDAAVSGTVDVADCIFYVPRHSTSSNGAMAFPPGKYKNVVVVWGGTGNYPHAAPPGVTITRVTSGFDSAVQRFYGGHPWFAGLAN